MKSKIYIFITTFLCLLLSTATPLYASEKPNSEVTLSEEVYADLAMRHALGHVSVYYFDGDIKNTISINADQAWVPASTIKLYAAMYAFYQIDQEQLSLDQMVTIDPSNVAASESVPGGYSALQVGDVVSVYRLLDQMITQSDNTAFNTLLDLLDRREITKYIHDLALADSSIGGKLNLNDAQQSKEVSAPGYGVNTTTASDYAKAFILINGGRIPGSKSLFNILSRQKLNSMLPANLPNDVIVAHKTGELDPYYHDGGIIYGPDKRYVLSIFSSEGEPELVAHISELIYTGSVKLVGANINPVISENVFPALDPLVAEADGQKVLAATDQNIKAPTVTASDLGIKASDLNQTLANAQLPPVIIPADSPLHILTDIGYKMTETLYPIKSVQTQFEANVLKMNLAEAKDLLNKNKKDQADTLLASVDSKLGTLAKDSSTTKNTSVQTTLAQVSETRFTILTDQLASATTDQDKIDQIKTIAAQAKNTTLDVVPNIQTALKKVDPAQEPVVGKVVSTSLTSVTVQTPGGENVTVPVDTQIKTRDASGDDTQTQNPTQIQIGTDIAIAQNFVLTNVATESINPKPVTVVKVDTENNILVISKDGVPQQIDLTKDTVIKGTDTKVSLDQIQAGDVLVVQGALIPATNSATLTEEKNEATPTAAPQQNSSSGTSNDNRNNNSSSGNSQTTSPTVTSAPIVNIIASSGASLKTNTPSATIVPVATATAVKTVTTTPIPVKTTVTTAPKTTVTVAPKATVAPKVTPAPVVTPPKAIQGTVIQVIQTTTPAKITSTPTPSTPSPAKTVSSTPAPQPATPAPTPKK